MNVKELKKILNRFNDSASIKLTLRASKSSEVYVNLKHASENDNPSLLVLDIESEIIFNQLEIDDSKKNKFSNPSVRWGK